MEPLKKILLCLRNVFTKKDDSVIPTDFSDLARLTASITRVNILMPWIGL